MIEEIKYFTSVRKGKKNLLKAVVNPFKNRHLIDALEISAMRNSRKINNKLLGSKAGRVLKSTQPKYINRMRDRYNEFNWKTVDVE